GTPFRRRYPGLRLVVTTRNDPPRDGPPPRRPPPPPAVCQLATEAPCQLGSPAGAEPNANARVCVPASVSTFSVVSSFQLTRMRPGTRMIAAPPNGRHCSPAAASRAGSQLSAALIAASVSGRLA